MAGSELQGGALFVDNGQYSYDRLDDMEGRRRTHKVTPRSASHIRAVEPVELRLGEIDIAPYDWHDDASCRGMDTDLFFDEDYDTRVAVQRVCAQCPVMDLCARQGVTEEFGIYGGSTANQRRRDRREERRAG